MKFRIFVIILNSILDICSQLNNDMFHFDVSWYVLLYLSIILSSLPMYKCLILESYACKCSTLLFNLSATADFSSIQFNTLILQPLFQRSIFCLVYKKTHLSLLKYIWKWITICLWKNPSIFPANIISTW